MRRPRLWLRVTARTAAGLAMALVALAPTTSTHAADLTIKQGDQVLRVNIATQAQLEQLMALDLDVWSHEIGVGPIDVHVSTAEKAAIDAAGLTYSVRNPDLSAAYAREKLDHVRIMGAGSFADYMDLPTQIAFMNNLVAIRPDLCSVQSIGTSVLGNPINVLHITGPGGGTKPGVFYHGLIHAREWIAGSVALYIADYLVGNYDTDPCVRDMVNRLDIYISNCVNPDGYAYTWSTTRLWRKNRRNNGGGVFGVDLNRNFTYQWGFDNSGSSGTTSSEIYRGPSAGSEPETQAVMNFLSSHTNIKAYMDYHSYSQLLMWPWGYTPTLTPDNAKFAAVGNYMQQQVANVNGVYYQPGPTNTTIYPANGVSIDYAYGAQGRFAYTIELRDAGDSGFLLPAAQILPTCQEQLAGIMYLTRWAAYGLLLDASNGVPARLTAGQSTPITVNINNAQETLVSGALRYRFGSTGPFSSTPLTLVTGTTYTASLPAGACGQTAQFYVTALGSSGSTVAQPCDAPTTFYTAPVLQPATTQVIYNFPMDTNPGWTTNGSWAFGHPSGSCGDPSNGFTGSNVYGYNLAGCYTDNIAAPQYLTTTALNCSHVLGTQLRLRRWLGVESAIYDHASIQASNDGASWTNVWLFTSGSTLAETAWSLQTYDISAVADGRSTVYVRWAMGPTDSGATYSGWNIDDVQILGVAVPDCSSVLLGDVNQDSAIDGLDVQAFVNVLLNPGLATTVQTCAADMDGACGVTTNDIGPFITLLLGT